MKSKYICELPSSDGRTLLSLEIFDYFEINNQYYYSSSVKVSGTNWDCKELIDESRDIETPVDDFAINFCQVLVPSVSLQELICKIELWIEQYEDFEYQLVNLSIQRVAIKIKNSNRSTLDKYKPSFIFEYSGGKISSFASDFIVDQTCLSNFLEGLKSVKGIAH